MSANNKNGDKQMKRIAALLLGMVFFSSVSAQQALQKLVINSHTPQDYADILSGRYKQVPVDVHGYLVLPVGTGKFPAVVIGPGSGGYKPWMAMSRTQLQV